MKKELTREQSAHLIELGVSADKASNRALDYKDINNTKLPLEYRPTLPIFTLADVIAMLPKGITHNGLSCKLRITSWYDEPWFAAYQNQVGEYLTPLPHKAPFSAEELIDALYELLCWVVENYSVDYLNNNQQ